MTDWTIEPLAVGHKNLVIGMTFPSYRHLLSLEPQPRHPELGDEVAVAPFGFVALENGRPLGLALAEVAQVAEPEAQLLSVFVESGARRRGLATALVDAVEQSARERGAKEISAIYTTGKPSIGFMEQVFTRRGWQAPQAISTSVRFKPDEALKSPAFDEGRLRAYARGLEIFPWSEVTAEELEEMRRSDAEKRWIERGLSALQYKVDEVDPSSVGARYKGRVVGWVINHRVIPDVVRWTVAYMRPDLSRRARVVPLFHASLQRLQEQGSCRFCTFITPLSYPPMTLLIRRWIAPISFFVEESRRASCLLQEERS